MQDFLDEVTADGVKIGGGWCGIWTGPIGYAARNGEEWLIVVVNQAIPWKTRMVQFGVCNTNMSKEEFERFRKCQWVDASIVDGELYSKAGWSFEFSRAKCIMQ